MRRLPLLSLVAGLLLAGLAATLARSEHERAREEQRREARVVADITADHLSTAFARAAAAIQLTARQPALMAFDEARGSTRAKIVRRRRELHDIRVVLDNLGRSDPGGIGQVLHADVEGVVTSVVRDGTVVPARRLEQVERAVVLRPLLAMTVGEVSNSRPYLSPAGGEWVVSASTVVPSRDNVKRSIVHAELLLESLRRSLGEDADHELVVVDRRTGDVVLHHGLAQRPGAALGMPSDRRFLPLRQTRADRGVTSLQGHAAAWQRVTNQHEGGNDWLVIARAPTVSPGLLDAAGPLPLGVGGAGVLLVLAGLLGLRRQQAALEEAAGTDALTGLGNRRALTGDLRRRINAAGAPSVLMLFDLDGFKSYNDSFGHAAGDALLQRMGRDLAYVAAVHGGSAYRLGGDEFCLLAPDVSRSELEAQARLALGSEGEGFAIGTVCGTVALPREARDADAALRLADDRLFAAKTRGRLAADLQSKDVLLRALAERNPGLSDHLGGVAEMAEAVARRMDLDADTIRIARHTGELHDVGKVAIPDAILHKPEALDDAEWAFMRRHPLIGERIVAAAPALSEVALAVRSTHERWDGEGYPDRLAGEAIPLPARIVAVCDAFEAMTSERPWRDARSEEQALGELARCAHHQFDARVVAAFAAEIGERLVRRSAGGDTGRRVPARPSR